MDDRIKELLDRIRVTATDVTENAAPTARYVGQRAGQILDTAKLNLQVFDLTAERNDLLRQMGQFVYDTHLGKQAEESRLSGLISHVDETDSKLTDLKERIAVLRQTASCPKCGAMCGKEDKYCKDCGAAL